MIKVKLLNDLLLFALYAYTYYKGFSLPRIRIVHTIYECLHLHSANHDRFSYTRIQFPMATVESSRCRSALFNCKDPEDRCALYQLNVSENVRALQISASLFDQTNVSYSGKVKNERKRVQNEK